MTPEQAKRAAFLIDARDDLQYELDAPESDREKWKHGPMPLSLMKDDAQFKLEICDDSGSMHTLATIDTGLSRRAVKALIADINIELNELGIVERKNS